MKYREIEYTDSDIGSLFIECCDEVFKHIHTNKDEFEIKFRKNKENILLDFTEYSGVFKFKFKIAHLREDTIREVTANIKRKRDKISTETSLKSINFNSTIIEDSDYFSPVIKSDINFNYNISYRDFKTIDLKGKISFFVKYLSKNKKKKVLKHCIAWKMKKTSHTAKSFYNMLLEQFKFTFNLKADYFQVYYKTNDDILKILEKNISNDDMFQELKDSFTSRNYKKKNFYNYDKTEDISIEIDTIEHIDMVTKSIAYHKDLIKKKKTEIDKLLEG